MIKILMSRGILASSIVYEHAKKFITPNLKVVIAYFSFFDKHISNQKEYEAFYHPGGEYYQKMIDTFANYGIKEEQITFLDYYNDSLGELKTKLNQADLLYLPGGAPEQMINRFAERNILTKIKDFTGIVVGSSAGAMIQNDYYHISPDRDYHKFEIYEGLGLIKEFGIEVHFRSRKKSKQAIRKVTKLMKRPLYTIPDDSAMIVNGQEITLINNAKKYYDQKGKIK